VHTTSNGDADRAAAARWFDRLRAAIDTVALHGDEGHLGSADEVVRERFTA
jgi:hypothetical protein